MIVPIKFPVHKIQTCNWWCFTTLSMSGMFMADIIISDPGGKALTFRKRSRPVRTARQGRTKFWLELFVQKSLRSSIISCLFLGHLKQWYPACRNSFTPASKTENKNSDRHIYSKYWDALSTYHTHYKNMPIQIYRKLYHQKMKIFR